MKSQAVSLTNGFLIPEIMIAFVLMTLFIISLTSLIITKNQMKITADKILDRLTYVSGNVSSTALYTNRLYGNDTAEKYLEPITILNSDYNQAWGRETCDPELTITPTTTQLYTHVIDLGNGNTSTDIEARDGFVYLTADSPTTSLPDFYIIDATNPQSSKIISALNTGPGLSSLEVAGPYVYAANLGTTNQLQIIDISNRSSPTVISKLKLPLPHASSTPPFATSIFYSQGLVYLGTEKWEGDEFAVIDVHDPTTPKYLGGYETNTQINDIYVRDGTAYLAASDEGQIRVLDVRDPTHIVQISQFSPSGWETQVGTHLTVFEKNLFFGRTTGGFNVVKNHELFQFSSTSDRTVSKDIPGGVYGIIPSENSTTIITHSLTHELQNFDLNLNPKSEIALNFNAQGVSCDSNDLYFATGDRWGIGILKRKL